MAPAIDHKFGVELIKDKMLFEENLSIDQNMDLKKN